MKQAAKRRWSSLKKHKTLWEDIEDVLVSRLRQNEKRIPLAKVKADLIKRGKLRG